MDRIAREARDVNVPFSRRTAWDLRPNAIARRRAERELEKRPPRFDLTEGNPTRVGLGWEGDALRAALDVHGAERYEPEPQGLELARKAIAAHHASRGVAMRADSLFVTASTSDAYSWIFKLLADPGDAVLVPRPGYPLFDYLAGLESIAVEHYAMRFDGDWWLDAAGLRARLAETTGPRVRAVVVVNPGNPTGAYLSRDEARELADLCAAHGIAIVSDEVFADYAHAPDPSRDGRARLESLAGATGALTFSLSGLSKVAALPQVKLGWLHVSGPQGDATEACRRLEIIADTWLPAGTPVQLAAPALLAGAPRIQARILERVRGNLAALRAQVTPDSPVSVLPVEGGWYAVLRGPSTKSDDAWVLELLDMDDVLVQPGYFFDFEQPGHLVVSLLPGPATFAEGAARLVSRLSR